MKYSGLDSQGVYLEDKLDKILTKDKGFYIELGANDGLQQSNTAFLEFNRGWSGILIEPSKNSYEKCKLNRPNSKCYNFACVSDDYKDEYISGDFDGGLMSSIGGARKNVSEVNEVKAITLEKILDENKADEIDFLSLDVEGYELNVLKGLNLQKYRPKYMLIEVYTKDYENIINYLDSNNYVVVCNFTNYNKNNNPGWDGTHNDYLFKLI